MQPTTRTAVLALGSGLAFAAFPLLRPWGDTGGGPLDMAAAFASEWWVAAHVSGMLGWALLAAALLSGANGAGTRRAAAAVAAGVAALLPYYGAEAFALHVLGEAALATGDPALAALEEPIRADPWAMTLFGTGLLLAGVGVLAFAVLARRGGVRGSGVLLGGAVLIALYLPQFFAPDVVRVAHGLLLGLALAAWAVALLRTAGAPGVDRPAPALSA